MSATKQNDPAKKPAGMGKDELRAHLKHARSGPIAVALAIDEDGSALLQVDKIKNAATMSRELKASAATAKSHRFGSLSVDPTNSKMLVFSINKEVSGIARKLKTALKGTGFTKVVIKGEDGKELERHEEPEDGDDLDEGGEVGQTIGKAVAAAGAAVGAAVGAVAGAAGAKNQQAKDDAQALAKLMQEFEGLLKRMLEAVKQDGSQKAMLSELATDARAAIKDRDVRQASAAIDVFRMTLKDVEQGKSSSAAPGKPAGPVSGRPPATPVAKPDGGGTAKGPSAADVMGPLVQAVASVMKETLPLIKGVPGLGDLAKQLADAAKSAIRANQPDEVKSLIEQIRDLQSKAKDGAEQTATTEDDATGDDADSSDADQDDSDQDGTENAEADDGADSQPGVDTDTPEPVAAKGADESEDPEVEALHGAHRERNEKAKHVWAATRHRVRGDLDKVFGSMDQALSGHGMADQLTKAVREKTEEALSQLDEELNRELEAVNKARSRIEREKRVEQARAHIKRYRDHIASDKSIELLDQNPFSDVSIRKTVHDTLAALEKTIR